jgi:hypothetical protein
VLKKEWQSTIVPENDVQKGLGRRQINSGFRCPMSQRDKRHFSTSGRVFGRVRREREEKEERWGDGWLRAKHPGKKVERSSRVVQVVQTLQTCLRFPSQRSPQPATRSLFLISNLGLKDLQASIRFSLHPESPL